MKFRLRTALRLAVACACAAVVLAPTASADLVVGVADDQPKTSPAIAERFYDAMNDVGLTEDRITILWDPTAPTTIRERDQIAHTVAVAAEHHVHLTFSIYPDRARAITDSPRATGEFAAFTAIVAREFPQVKDFIVGNEPNKGRFWQPQFNPDRTAAACAAYEPVLAASYDALKRVDSGITVIGVGLGPRGSDNPFAGANLSISPLRCKRSSSASLRRLSVV